MFNNTPEPTHTEQAPDLERLINSAEADMRSPGTYLGLARTLVGELSDEVTRSAGLRADAHPDDIADEVIKMLAPNAVVLFDRPGSDDRKWVYGSSKGSIDSVLVPVPAKYREASELKLVVMTDSTDSLAGGSGWQAREADTRLAETIVDITTPDQTPAEQRIEELEQDNRQLEAKIEELKAERVDLKANIQRLENDLSESEEDADAQ